jgi:hypothetical protein
MGGAVTKFAKSLDKPHAKSLEKTPQEQADGHGLHFQPKTINKSSW